jgi:hypothetical protein
MPGNIPNLSMQSTAINTLFGTKKRIEAPETPLV